MAKKQGFFITGTDTDCGKTQVSEALIRYLQTHNLKAAGLKPIASGFELRGNEWKNSDIEALTSASNVDLDIKLVNRYRYREPIAPHIAAEKAGETIDISLISDDVVQSFKTVDALVVEAVGGWLVPLDSYGDGDSDNGVAQSVETLAEALKLPVILVVGMKLGCLNHALLTARAIMASKVAFLGWVANRVDPHFERAEDNILTLERKMPVPKLFELPYFENGVESCELNAFSDRWLSLWD